MNAHSILFKTNRFNLSEVKEHFINPCCFGEDLAAWLRTALTERGVEANGPSQEDWGWYLRAKHGPDSYFLAISGNADGNPANSNHREGRIIVQTAPPLVAIPDWQRTDRRKRCPAPFS